MKDTKHITVGIVAHVDAGKTTLAEAMLFLSGKTRTLGSVDGRDSVLDTHALERQRGITVFSKQAEMSLPHTAVTLLDTPGHADFIGETERALAVMDYALLVISGTDGVQAHTQTVARLMEKHRIPLFIFITKMDISNLEKERILQELRVELGGEVVDFQQQPAALSEQLAICSENAMEEYLAEGDIREETVASLIRERRVFPCLSGSGLKLEGVRELLELLDRSTSMKDYGHDFSARVYKITRDARGTRLTHMKITGGSLSVKDRLLLRDEEGEVWEEKADSIRVYSGEKYESREKAEAGMICAIPGLLHSYAGMNLGQETGSFEISSEPVMNYRLRFPNGEDPQLMYRRLLPLQEEDPLLHLRWNASKRQIELGIMGRIQAEILQGVILQRFDCKAEICEGSVIYKETIRGRVEGIGHFEPLRHYAEVHLILDPLPPGSGIVLRSICPEDELDRNWQRLILTHLREKQHIGVLTGAPVTDIRITLAAGRAHLKHTEGGDFREATYRAVRQGLMKAESVLLEPIYRFSIRVPADNVGRVMSDVRAMHGDFGSPENSGDMVLLEGTAPVSEINAYSPELLSFTHGKGSIRLTPEGYRPCHNAQKIRDEAGYLAEADLENPADSVFCSHGSGVTVSWNRVEEYMHLPSCLQPRREASEPVPSVHRPVSIDDKELEAIMLREFGPVRRPEYRSRQMNAAPVQPASPSVRKKERILVDGYNVLFAWKSLRETTRDNLDLARTELTVILSNYAAFTGSDLILVFDGFRTAGNPGSRTSEASIHIVYTKEGETADAYIEKLSSEMGSNRDVRVVTGDNMIRLTALKSGVMRTSSEEFEGEVRDTLCRMETLIHQSNHSPHMTKLKDGKN